MAQQQSEIRYLTPPSVDVKKKKYCRFKKSGIKYIDYKDPEFLKKFLNEQVRSFLAVLQVLLWSSNVVLRRLLKEHVTWRYFHL